jgi:N-acyl-D-amino-acid deacylase
MKNILLATFCLISCLLAAQNTDVALVQRVTQLDSALSYLHDRTLFNGVVLLAENGKVTYQKNYGITDIRNPQPLQVSSSFNLASISKQFMCAMICLLQENGRLGFDDKVQKHLPEFPYPDISVRQLMNHTSGVPEYFDLCIRYTGALDTIDNQNIMQLLADLKPPLDFAPGEKWQYSNTGYVVIGSLIEKLSGKSIADYFTEKITRPLGLKNTYIFNLKMKSSPANRVYGFHREDGKNKLDDLMRFDGIVGDGNVYSSAEDLLKWTQALHSDKLLKPATYAEMMKPAPLNNGTTHPYGFGIGFSGCNRCAVHTGGWVGFLNLLSTDFEQKKTLVILSSGGSSEGIRAGQKWLKGEKIILPQTQLIANVLRLTFTSCCRAPERQPDLGNRRSCGL